MSQPKIDPKLKELARNARSKSYSPYSNCKVGAVIRLSNGKLYTGCNVENSSYGASHCAERTAITKAVSEEGPQIQIEEIVVATDASPPWSPCGICRQVIIEFAAPTCMVHLVNLGDEEQSHLFKTLLPFGFDREVLLGKIDP